MNLEEETLPEIENPAIEHVEKKPKMFKIKVGPSTEPPKPETSREPTIPKPTPIQSIQPTKRERSPSEFSIKGRSPSPAPSQVSIHSEEENMGMGESIKMAAVGNFIFPFSKHQTVAMIALSFALFLKSLETLIALRENIDKQMNEVFYTLFVLLCVSMFLNFVNAAILVRLGIKKDDETNKTCEPCACCCPYMWKPRYMSSEQLIYMCCFVTVIIVIVEVCIAVLHINVSNKN